MTAMINSSPYGSQMNLPASPQGGGSPRGGLWQSLFGRPERNYQQSTLGQEQQPLYQQLQSSLQNRGAGGAFGQSADYYRDLLGNDSADFNAFAAPEMRRYNEQTIPDLAEQFASMGSGGLSSSGFRNAAVGAGADLGERLGAIRAGLRGQAVEGLSSMGRLGLGSYNENIHRPETHGLIGESLVAGGRAAGNAAGRYAFGGS